MFSLTNMLINQGFILLAAIINAAIKGSGLRYIANSLSQLAGGFANIFTDNDKDNEKQLKTYLRDKVSQLPNDLCVGIVEHTNHGLTDAEAQELQTISIRFGELFKKALK